MGSQTYHIAMYPWFAVGHITPFLHLSNKLAKKGHKISFFIPTKTQQKFEYLNLHPDLITFIPITVPNVEGLPTGAETTWDIPLSLGTFLMTAMDLTKNQIELQLIDLKVDVVLFDFVHWIPDLTHRLGIKSICYCVVSSTTAGYLISPQRQLQGNKLTEADLMHPPAGFPSSAITLHVHEARAFFALRATKFGGKMLFYDRLFKSLSQCDAIALWACREIEGPYCDYLEHQFCKPVFLTGPIIPEPPALPLEEEWAKWLDGFEFGSVIYCAFGSECILEKGQFQELLIGLELTGMPFLAALKTPFGAESVESALPENFHERLRGRGVVHGGWVQQRLILEHPSVGCFITHCGAGSSLEGLINKCQLVLLPHVGDHIFKARMMSRNLKVGVEIEKGEEDGLFTRESVCKAVRTVMEEGGGVAEEVRANHGKLRELLKNKDLDSSYIDSFTEKLQELLV